MKDSQQTDLTSFYMSQEDPTLQSWFPGGPHYTLHTSPAVFYHQPWDFWKGVRTNAQSCDPWIKEMKRVLHEASEWRGFPKRNLSPKVWTSETCAGLGIRVSRTVLAWHVRDPRFNKVSHVGFLACGFLKNVLVLGRLGLRADLGITG